VNHKPHCSTLNIKLKSSEPLNPKP
jgi:hypothetical protein